jgi:5'-3' exonuclease
VPVIGAPQHEADDVIGTLASHSPIPVDVVTGDRDLFQLVDDTRQVRVIYTGRGMSPGGARRSGVNRSLRFHSR